jgi:hypothetical protein
MIFRDFVEETKDAVRELAAGARGDRDITPMVHLETETTGRELVAVDPQFFTTASDTKPGWPRCFPRVSGSGWGSAPTAHTGFS